MPDATPPVPALPAAAVAAWDAYLAMAASKAAHFAALSSAPGDRRGPQLAQAALRATRLAEHDACVARFKDAVRSLATHDAAAHRALLAAIAAHAADILATDADEG
jgi:hypothetical protein